MSVFGRSGTSLYHGVSAALGGLLPVAGLLVLSTWGTSGRTTVGQFRGGAARRRLESTLSVVTVRVSSPRRVGDIAQGVRPTV